MEIEIYDENIGRLEKWHKKDLTEDQHDMFFRLLSTVADLAFPQIIERWLKSSKPLPGQFPTVENLLELWRIWQKENPDLIEKIKRPKCDKCHGRGWLWFIGMNQELGFTVEYCVGCASCFGFKVDIGKKRWVPISTRSKLELNGFDVWPYEYKGGRKFKTLDEMTGSIGEYE